MALDTAHAAKTPEMSPKRKFFPVFRPALVLVLALSFLLTVYGPLELYFTNTREFAFDFSALFPVLLKLFLLVTAAGLLAFSFCYALHIRLYNVILVIAAVGFVCTYIQGMFLSGHLPPLDGRAINWNEYLAQDAASVLLWLAVGTAAATLVRKLRMENMYRLITYCALFLSAILLVTLVTVGIQTNGFASKYQAVMTKESEFEMSTDQNFVIFVVDAVDSATFRHLMESDTPEFADTLEDFTYYPNTVGAYPFTQESIPFILTGAWYENQENFSDFTTQAMDDSPLLTALSEAGYRLGMYEEALTYDSDNVYRFENAEPLSYRITSFNRLAREELKLVWFKYAPFPLKRLGHVNMEAFSWLVELESGGSIFHANNSDFYGDLLDASIQTGPDKCFRFIHIEGAHVPFRYDKNVRPIDEAQGSYPQNIEASMTIVKTYLERLKEAGAYDNTIIILMADHGYGYNRDIPILGRGNPLLAVKGMDEHHAMSLSEAPISYEDLQTAYQRLLSGVPGNQVFDAKEGEERPRRFLAYHYEKEAHMEEYMQQGDADNIDTMLSTGNVYDRAPHDGPPRAPKGSDAPQHSPGHTAFPIPEFPQASP